MEDRKDGGQDGCRTRKKQSRTDAGQDDEGQRHYMQDDCRTGQMHYRTDAGQEGQVSGRREQMQYRMDAGQVKYITGRMMETFISFYSWKIFL